MNYEITSLQLLEKWEAALEIVKNIIIDYPNAPDIIRNVRMLEMISIQKLKTPQLAIDILNDFISRYPQHKLNTLLKNQIKAINKMGTQPQPNDARKPSKP